MLRNAEAAGNSGAQATTSHEHPGEGGSWEPQVLTQWPGLECVLILAALQGDSGPACETGSWVFAAGRQGSLDHQQQGC